MRKFERGGIDREGLIECHKGLVGAWNGRNSAKDDGFLVWAGNAATSAAWEETFAWGEDAAVIAPEIAENWRNDAVMHVAGDEEIEFIEIALDFLVVKEDRGVNKGDFGLVLW